MIVIAKRTDTSTGMILKDGSYLGLVVDNQDPLKLGRVRVRVYSITDQLTDEHLPWYLCIRPVSSTPNASAAVPPRGSEVVVEFPDNSIYNGLVRYMAVSKPPR